MMTDPYFYHYHSIISIQMDVDFYHNHSVISVSFLGLVFVFVFVFVVYLVVVLVLILVVFDAHILVSLVETITRQFREPTVKRVSPN